MTRKKLNLAYITNDSMRKATFNKRKKGFMKKIHELSVLCGIEACAVIYSPYISNPEVWPSNSGVKTIVEKFEALPESDQERKMVNHEGFLRQSITKTLENNKRKMKENKEMMMKEAMFLLLGGKGHMFKLTDRDHVDLCKYIDRYLNDLYRHRDELMNQPRLEFGESSSATGVTAPPAISEVDFSSIPYGTNFFNSPPQPKNELWALEPINGPNQRPEQVNTFGNMLFPAVNDQQGYYQMMNPVGGYDQHPNLNLDHNQYQQQFGNPMLAQDGGYNPNQNQNQQEEWLVSPMMNQPEQMSFPTMDGNSGYNHHQP